MISEETIREVFSDEDFVKTLFALETPEEVQLALKEKNIELSIEEILKVRDLLLKTTGNSGILSDEDLQEVSGGAIITAIAGVVLLVGFELVAGAAFAGTICLADWTTGGKW